MKKARLIAATAAAVVSASALALSASAYNAYLAFQTNQYTFRNNWDEGNYGKATPYYNNVIVWGQGDNPDESYPDYADCFSFDLGTDGGYLIPATIKDATVTSDGTYTVSIDTNYHVRDDDTFFNMIFVSTDIPTDEGVTISDVKLSFDGKVVKTIDTYDYDPNAQYVSIYAANVYAPELGAWNESYPDKNISIEFKVTGLAASDTQAATESKDAPAPTTGDTTAETTSSKGSPDTGIADVAAIAGLAVVAGAGIVITRKRK